MVSPERGLDTGNGEQALHDEHRRDLVDRFLRAAELLNRQLHADRLDEWQRSDLSVPQVRTLLLLQRTGPLRMGSIAHQLGRALSATTTVVDRLVEPGLVDRSSDPHDRRVVVCQLTDRGQEMIERFWSIGRERIRPLVDSLDLEELEKAVAGLEIISRVEPDSQPVASPNGPSD